MVTTATRRTCAIEAASCSTSATASMVATGRPSVTSVDRLPACGSTAKRAARFPHLVGARALVVLVGLYVAFFGGVCRRRRDLLHFTRTASTTTWHSTTLHRDGARFGRFTPTHKHATSITNSWVEGHRDRNDQTPLVACARVRRRSVLEDPPPLAVRMDR